jgi:hypothetical protein
MVRFPGSAYEDLFVAWLQTGQKAAFSHESALSLYDLYDVLLSEILVILPITYFSLPERC